MRAILFIAVFLFATPAWSQQVFDTRVDSVMISDIGLVAITSDRTLCTNPAIQNRVSVLDVDGGVT